MTQTPHTIPLETGETLAAVHHAPSGTPTHEAWVVCCHGFVSDKAGSYEARCERATGEGYHAVRFDFRGCGDSDGAFVEQTLSSKIADLRAVLAYFDADSYVLFGSSFGAKTAFHAAVDDERVRAVAGRAALTYNRAFDQLRALIERDGSYRYDTGHTVDERFFADFDAYAFTDVTDRLDAPVALFHGRADGSVAAADAVEAAGAFDGDVLLQLFAGEGHRFSPQAEARLRDCLFEWLAEQ